MLIKNVISTIRVTLVLGERHREPAEIICNVGPIVDAILISVLSTLWFAQ
jgi:hypothetical protein